MDGNGRIGEVRILVKIRRSASLTRLPAPPMHLLKLFGHLVVEACHLQQMRFLAGVDCALAPS